MKNLKPLIFWTLVCSFSAAGQLSLNHYLPPLSNGHFGSNTGSVPGENEICISTPSANNVDVTLSFPGNAALDITLTVSEGASICHSLPDGYASPMLVKASNNATDVNILGSVNDDLGAIVSATEKVYVNFRVRSNNNAQAEIYTSKGTSAIGTEFRTAHLLCPSTYEDRLSFVSVMALNSNTTITISEGGMDLGIEALGHPTNQTSLTETLDQYETKIFAVRPDNADNSTAFIGSLLESNKDIVVVVGSMNGSMYQPNPDAGGSRDYAVDQIVPTNLVGEDYILFKGNGVDTLYERIIVVAHTDNTDVFINEIFEITLDAGEYLDVSDYDANGLMYVNTSMPSYVYQPVLGSATSVATPGMFFVPPISCNAPSFVNEIPDINTIGSYNFTGSINIVSRDIATILVNGVDISTTNSIGSANVLGPYNLPYTLGPNNSLYKAYRIDNLSGDVSIVSDYDLYCGLFGYAGVAGYGAYFSGFNSPPEIMAADLCGPTTLSMEDSGGAIQWFKDDVAIPGANQSTYNATEDGTYRAEEIINNCEPLSTNNIYVSIPPAPVVSAEQRFCTSENATVADLEYTANNDNDDVIWYSSETGGTALPDNTLLVDNTVYWGESVDGVPCYSLTRTATLVFLDEAVTSDAGDDQTICPNETANIMGITGGPLASSLWSSSGDGLFANVNMLNTTYTAGANDILLGSVTLTLTVSPTTGACPDVSDELVLLLEDNENPVASCPSDIAVDTDTGVCEALVTYTLPASSDNCSVTSVADMVSGAVFALGTTTVTVTATDGAGNTDTCTFDVVVSDNENPAASCPSDIAVDTDAGVCESLVTYTLPASSDNCSVTSVADMVSGAVFALGTTTVIVTATDGAGNTDTCTFDVVVSDNENPVASCPSDIAVDTDAGVCEALVTYTLPSSSDNCSVTSVADMVSGAVFALGTTTVIVTATDGAGNTDNCTFDVVVSDNENPVASCPSDIAVDTDAGVCEALVTYTLPASSDNCSVTSVADMVSGAVFALGTTTVTVTATDGAGNTDTCTFDVVVSDNENPVASCPSDIAVDTDAGVCEALVTYTLPASSDNCSVTSVADMVSGAVFALGTTTVTVTATDGAGNTDTCTFDVVVSDNENPAASCPSDIAVDTDAGVCESLVTYTLPASSDNCSVTSVADMVSGAVFALGTTTVIVTATDGAGNTDTCTFDVVVSDNENPVASCPSDIAVDTDAGVCEALVTYTLPSSSDNCTVSSSASIPSGAVFALGTTTVIVTATDGAGNTDTCTFDVVVSDNENPVASCPSDIAVDTDAGVCEALVTYTLPSSSDNCTVSSSASIPSGAVFALGTTTVIVTATDGAGNTDTCTFDVVVSDNENPVASCPSDIAVDTDAGVCEALVTYTLPSSSDNCTVSSSASIPSGAVFALGTTTVTVTATDGAGNTDTCTFDVVVSDNENPVASCPSDIAVDTDAGVCEALVTYTLPSSSDNCTVSSSASIPSGAVFALGTTTVIVTATDGAGNTDTCTFDVVVSDNENPVASCPSDIAVDTDAGVCEALVTYTLPSSSDNCTVSSSASIPSGAVFALGTTTVTVTAIDGAGNTDTCTFDVVVSDNENPVASCPSDIAVDTDAGVCEALVTYTLPSSSDNCSVTSVADMVSGAVFALGTTTVTVTATDGAGNTDACTFDVVVSDNENPTAICQSVTLSLDTNGEAVLTAAQIDGGSTDNCGVASVEISQGDQDWDCSEVGMHTVTLTVTDANGNVSTCVSTVTVEDNVDPTAICQDITIELDADGNANIVSGDIDNGSSDNCGVASIEISQDDEDWDCSEVGTNTVTLTVTDVNGNVSTCDGELTVEDNVAPIAICQDITIGLDANGEAFITAADIDNGSNDACGTPSLSIAGEDEDWDCSEVGTHTVTLTVTDVNGNISTCAGELTVEDTIAPILVCNDVLVDLDPGLCGDIVQYAIETEDNCGVATEVLVSGPASGTYLDYHDSPWSVTWDVTDVNGNLSTCTFSITVNEYGNPTETLVCNDLVLVSLDEDGCSEIGADMVLEGGPYGCYDDYQVSVENGSAEVCCEDIGESLSVTVTDPDTGNSCTGTLEVYDNLSPYCVSIADYTIACEEEVPSADDIAHEGYPVFGDNCGIFQIYLASETTIESDICSDDGMQIERIWFALDLSGNVVSPEDVCVQTITIERTALTFLSDAEYDCADYETADLHPDLTGYPHPSQSSACMYAATYTDQLLPACGGLEKIVRTWTVLDWCSGMILTQDGSGNDNVQILKITDSTGPEIGEETYVLNAENADFCSTQGFLSLPEITDNCTSVEEINMFIAGLTELDYVTDGTGSIIGGYIPFPGLPLGDYEVLVTATDACGNYSERLLELSVEDLTAPTPVCDEITQVSLGSSGTAEVFALTFDDGSNDNCCLDGFDVRRMDGGDYGSSVVFACEDIGSSVAVELRVHDCHGNSNSCMVEVLVEDKIPPYLVTPADTDISCDDYYSDVAPHLDNGDGSILETLFGSSSSGDNCEVIETYSYTYSVDQCGEGSIVRSWTVNDPSGNGPVSGTQTISIYHVSDWSISFPGDLDASCVDGTLPDFGYPTVSDDECEMIAISYVDTQFDVVPDACYKIIREWSAINWCTYPEEAAVTAIQVIKVTDNEAPIFNVDDFTVEITEADCDTPVTLPTPEVTDCSDAVTIETSSDLPAGEAGPGTYTANYTVSDGCGNYSYDVITITVVDAKKPTPYVTDHLVTEIMQTGMTGIINVNDYDIGSFDNCSDVVLSFSSDVTDTDRQFTCEDLGENTLEIWVTDEAGNQDFVTVTMEVQDNMNACGPGTLTIAGALTTQDGEGIDGAMVDVNSGAFTEMTAGDGLFSFTLPSGGDYSIVPSLDTDADNGVTTYDMVLITQHILGVNTFTTPYNYIAADANNSQTVTTLDLVAIRKVILQIADSFPNNTSWRFVDADHVFTDATDPWDYPEVINYNNLDTDQLETDFIGIKIGDVNGSVQSNMNAAAEARTGDRVSVSTLDASLSAGEETIVALSLNERLSGIQFTLVHEGLTFKGVEGGLCGADQVGQHDGQLTLSWNDSELRRLDGVDLIQLRFEANRAIDLSEGLYISSAKTRSEAYTANGIAELDLIFEGQSAGTTILYDNVPNPFKEETVISFSLAQAAKVSIRITDLNGKVIRTISGDYGAGYNSIELQDLKTTGVLYYQLETDGFTAIKKMVKM